MSATTDQPLRVALDPAVAAWAPEVKYALRTLLRTAGYAYEFVWSTDVPSGGRVDLYYGRLPGHLGASVNVRAALLPFDLTSDPHPLSQHGGLPFLEFGDFANASMRRNDGAREIANDIVLASYWLLIGSAEARMPRDRWDNIEAGGSFVVEHRLLERPVVSLYAAMLRDHFSRHGRPPLLPPWQSGGARAAFAFTHDVDYPQVIRWIETLRLLRSRGVRGFGTMVRLWNGQSHFWRFADWIDFERQLGARPAFYFMARKGSLWQYARGTPDAFYDIQAREFRGLFQVLRDHGAEVGLHASYHAHRSLAQLQSEKRLLENAAGVEVRGGRHHYWHLDPSAPHETLRKHEQIGLHYDSSLGFEFFPGYRRGICHPFRVFHPGERRELDLIQLPPAWMDDHFDRRLTKNGIKDPEASARSLMEVARQTGGVVVIDYHVRGMNEDFFPRYGAWLKRFLRANIDASLAFQTPAEIAESYRQHESILTRASRDLTSSEPVLVYR